MRFLRGGTRVVVAGIGIAAAFLLAGCVTGRSGPDISKYAFMYTDCVQKNGGKVTSFKVNANGGHSLAFDDFQSENDYSDEQLAAMRACYEQRVAAAN